MTHMKILSIIICLFCIGCTPKLISYKDTSENKQIEKRPIQVRDDLVHTPYLGIYNYLQVVSATDGCQYVLWHNRYGSDMEHSGSCNNSVHKQK